MTDQMPAASQREIFKDPSHFKKRPAAAGLRSRVVSRPSVGS